jgi:tetratricopeptide (TPR) repeat protein
MIRPALLLLACMSLLAALPAGAGEEELRALEQAVTQDPGNVDARMALAARLSWHGRLEQAREHAFLVVEQAPGYWDAHLLLARIDGWQGRYDEAFARIERVLKSQPTSREAIALWADIALWSQRDSQIALAAERLEALGRSADVYYLRAQLAYRNLYHWRAYRLTDIALLLEPGHELARKLHDDIQLLAAGLSGHFDYFGNETGTDQTAFGQELSLSLLPRAFLSLHASYDYQRRFDSHNHRLSLRSDWRVDSRLSLSVMVRGGAARVVPPFTALLEASYQLTPAYAVAASYIFDTLPWPGEQHRVVLTGVAVLPARVRAEAALSLSYLHSCGRYHPAPGISAGLIWQRAGWQPGLQYQHGVELERAPIPGFLERRYGSDLCSDMLRPAEAALLRPVDTRSHTLGHHLDIPLDRQTDLRAGYTLQFRDSGSEVHLLHAGVRRWF